MIPVLRALLTVLALALAPAAFAQDGPKVRLELAPETTGLVPGGVTHVAVRQTIAPGWHTYWRNAGDAGEAPAVRWTLPEGWRAGGIVWPTPRRLPELGDLMTFGYEGEVLLPVPIEVPASARPGQMVTLTARVNLLVCKDICIPESGRASLTLPVVAGAPAVHPRFGEAVAETLRRAPRPAGLAATVSAAEGGLRLAVTGPELRGADAADAYFFPFDGAAIRHDPAQAVERGPEGLTLSLKPAREGGGVPTALAGVLALADGRAFEVKALAGPPLAGAAGLGPPARPDGGGGGLTLPLALAFAFLGGLILNLMPCVFPVLAMKAAALAAHAHDRGAARVQGLAYGAGVATTFLLLAGVLIALKAAGQSVGWGFQLQSPAVTAALALLMLLIAADFAGVVRIGGAVQGLGGGRLSEGPAGAFAAGALAVVVAAPCSAPFMAAAVGYAVVQPAVVGLAVFAALAAGFALPLMALSLSPPLLGLLPRPGPWMVTLQRWLAIPMLAAALWLGWVSWRQIAPAEAGTAAVAARLPSEAFTPARLVALRAEGRPVFVNFTADWCVTCKVNEGVALDSRRVAEALRETGAVYLKADWTRRDGVIAAALAEHGRAGVPLYLVYPAGGGAPETLPQLLTEGAVEAALRRASAGAAVQPVAP